MTDQADVKAWEWEDKKCEVNEKWHDAESWLALVQLNREFILQCQAGEDVETPYHGPLDEETTKLIPGLLRLHEYRLLTVGSQPIENLGPHLDDGFWNEEKQVPFLDFWMPHEGATTEAFISNLMNDSQLTTHVCDDQNNLRPGSNTVEIDVSMWRTSTWYDELLSAEWHACTSIQPHELFDGVLEGKAAEDANPLFCNVLTSVNINLLERVESHAIKAGLERTSFDNAKSRWRRVLSKI